MFLDMLLFSFMAYRYKYVEDREQELVMEEKPEPLAISNAAFSDDETTKM